MVDNNRGYPAIIHIMYYGCYEVHGSGNCGKKRDCYMAGACSGNVMVWLC